MFHGLEIQNLEKLKPERRRSNETGDAEDLNAIYCQALGRTQMYVEPLSLVFPLSLSLYYMYTSISFVLKWSLIWLQSIVEYALRNPSNITKGAVIYLMCLSPEQISTKLWCLGLILGKVLGLNDVCSSRKKRINSWIRTSVHSEIIKLARVNRHDWNLYLTDNSRTPQLISAKFLGRQGCVVPVGPDKKLWSRLQSVFQREVFEFRAITIFALWLL